MRNWILSACLLLAAAGSQVRGQTKIDLGRQSKNVDFSAVGPTRPFQVGTTLPSTCEVGEMFFKSGAPAGSNIYSCTSTDTFVLQAGVTSHTALTELDFGSSGHIGFQQALGFTPENAANKNQILGYAGLDAAVKLDRDQIPIMTGDSGLGGESGAVPTPAAGDADNCLKGDGSWASCGTGGGGASLSSELGDLSGIRTSATVLTVGDGCSPATPCIVGFGNKTYSFTASATATITSGSGTVHVYVDSDGNLTVGHDADISCSSGCVSLGGVTAFPPDALPLFTWTASNNEWEIAGITDHRAWLSSKPIVAGLGVAVTEAAGKANLALDTTTAVLVGAASPCAEGQVTKVSSGTWTCLDDAEGDAPLTPRDNLREDSGNVDWTPMDTTVFWLQDEFCAGGTASGSIGTLGWNTSVVGVEELDYLNGELNHPCTLRTATSVADDDEVVVSLADGTADDPLFRPDLVGGWAMVWIFRLGTTANVSFRAGLIAEAGASATDVLGLRFDTDAGDTSFVLLAGPSNLQETGVAVDGNWHKIEVWSDWAGEVSLRLDGGTTYAFDSNLPAANLTPAFGVQTRTTGPAEAGVDLFAMKWRGLER